jgi:hypothetical protein
MMQGMGLFCSPQVLAMTIGQRGADTGQTALTARLTAARRQRGRRGRTCRDCPWPVVLLLTMTTIRSTVTLHCDIPPLGQQPDVNNFLNWTPQHGAWCISVRSCSPLIRSMACEWLVKYAPLDDWYVNPQDYLPSGPLPHLLTKWIEVASRCSPCKQAP